MAARTIKPYCCAVDLVTRALPVPGQVTYPSIRKRLVRLMVEDQQERMSGTFYSDDTKLINAIAERETSRAKEVSDILQIIKTPSARNVGLDGSRAVWLIVLHNTGYEGLGRKVLQKMRHLYRRDRNEVFYPGIPYLADMVTLETKGFDHSAKQLYGTRYWVVRERGGRIMQGVFPIWDPKHLAERRKKFDLVEVPGMCQHRL